MNNKLTDYIVCDSKTGEYIQNLTVDEVEMLKDNYTTANISKINDSNVRESENLFYQYIKETCGGFYFHYYNKMDINQHTFRFMYMCTYMNYKGYMELGNAKDEGRLCVKKDLIEILKLGKTETYKTINYLLDNNLITIDKNEYVKINTNICVKGKLNNKKEVVRMFDDGIKEIYKNSLPKEHKKLALLIKILPYVHFDLNVICSNPNEEYPELIKPITLTELTKILDYSTTQRLKKGLMTLKVNNEYVIMITKISNKDMIVVNPKIYYKGNQLDKMEGIINLFKIAN